MTVQTIFLKLVRFQSRKLVYSLASDADGKQAELRSMVELFLLFCILCFIIVFIILLLFSFTSLFHSSFLFHSSYYSYRVYVCSK